MKRRYWIVLAALSCAGPKMAQAPQATQPSLRERQANEIIALDSEIRDWRVDAGLPAVPERKHYNQPEIPWSRAQSDECKTVCDLADSICSNKDKICDIAEEMPGDTWAKGKCETAKASCHDARERCLDCGK